MERIEWKISVPIFTNTLILQQLGIAIGIPFGIVVLVVGLASGKSVYMLYGLGLIIALLLLTWLFMLAVYRGNYDAEFVLDNEGALCRTQAKQAKKNWLINILTVVLGIFSGKPAITGAGLLAQSRQAEFLRWKRVRQVKFQPKGHTFLLRGSAIENMALFCTAENYPQIEGLVQLQTKHLKDEGSKA